MKFILTLQVLILSLILLSSCQKEEIAGSEIINVTDDEFNNYTIRKSHESINFSKQEEFHLTSTFKENKTVNIEFTGLSSGAEKKISLNTSKLNYNNTTWKGGSSNKIGFQEEKVQIKISFYGTNKFKIDTILVTGIQNYHTSNVINSFVNGFEKEHYNFHIPKISERTSEINTPQGKNCLKVNFDLTKANYNYIGSESKTGNYIGLPEITSDIYFNIYVYGINDPKTYLSVQFMEDDNGNKKFDQGIEDGVLLKIPLGHKGWKLISLPYNKAKFSTYSPGGGNGNKKLEPEKVITIDYGVESQKSQAGSFYIDFPIFTIGGPFNPKDY